MPALAVALFILLGPLPYWLLGCAALSLVSTGPSRDERLETAPLLGLFLFGWLGTVCLVLSLPVAPVTLAAFPLSALILWKRGWPQRTPFLWESLWRHYVLYAVAVAALALSPYPGFGNWSGDWLDNYRMGEAVLRGQYSSAMLGRAPIFGATYLPLAVFSPGLIAFQIMSAVASSSALLVVGTAIRAFRRTPIGGALVWSVLLSAFYMLHVVTLWPKFLAAGALVVAMAEAFKYRWERRQESLLFAWFWFGASIAVHHSSVLLLPLLLIPLLYRTGDTWPARIGTLIPSIPLGLITFGVFEVGALVKFGWEARATNNPTIYYRSGGTDFWSVLRTSVDVFIVTLTGRWLYGVLNAAQNLSQNPQKWLALAFLSFSAWITVMAGTFLGVLAPWLAMARYRSSLKAMSEKARAHPFFWPMLTAVLITLCLHAWASPYASPWGNMQVGVTGLALLLFVWLAWLSEGLPPQASSWILRLSLILGGGPFLLLNAGTLFMLVVPTPLHGLFHRQLGSSDSDYRLYQELGSQALSYQAAPMALFSIALLCAFLLRYRPTSTHVLAAGSPSKI